MKNTPWKKQNIWLSGWMILNNQLSNMLTLQSLANSSTSHISISRRTTFYLVIKNTHILHVAWHYEFNKMLSKDLPPPFLQQRYGNLQKFPRPMMCPATARMNSVLLPHSSLSGSLGGCGDPPPGFIRFILTFGIFWSISIFKKNVTLSIISTF